MGVSLCEVDSGRTFAPGFVTTRWSEVLAAAEADPAVADQALERLCSAYWYPIYASVRRRGHDAHTAQDLTQAFFARLLHHHSLRSVRREKGKFRSYLLACLGHFLANAWRDGHTLKRGGLVAFVPLDFEQAEQRFEASATASVPGELAYDREWALDVLDQAMARLEFEATASGKLELFGALRPFLVEPTADGGYEAIARAHHMTSHAVSMAVSRLRGRLRAAVREIVASTVTTPFELEEELQHLRNILSR